MEWMLLDLTTDSQFEATGARVIWRGAKCPQDCDRRSYDDSEAFTVSADTEFTFGDYYDVWCPISETWWLARVV